MLVDLSTRILEDLDDNRGAVSVMSIDYSKAFNRLKHNECLEAMARKGSSNQAMTIAASFLGARTMRMKVGSTLSTYRNAPGGAPQGTKSGNFFFTLSIDEIETSDTSQTANADIVINQNITAENAPVADTRMASQERSFDSERSMNIARTDGRIRRAQPLPFLDETVQEQLPSQEEHEINTGFPPRWKKRPPWILKFVDDVTVGSRNLISHSTSHITTTKERRSIHAGDLEREYEKITANSSKAGMVVNPAKTQLLCVNQAINYEVSAFMNVEGNRIESADELRILGFHFDKKGDMKAQVRSIKKKFAKRVWILRHLKRANLPEDKLLAVYCSFIRASIDYASVVYNSMITKTQSDDIERLQAIALKTIYGWSKSYRVCLQQSGLTTLAKRRCQATLNFAKRNATNPRFPDWFPTNTPTTYNLRVSERYRIDFARHERLRNAPLYHMRRLLNDLDTEGDNNER